MSTITFKEFDLIEFPAFKLQTDDIYSENNRLCSEGLVIDDKNMPGKTMGARRLQTKVEGLYPLKRAIFDRVSLIRAGGGPYVDNMGRFFIYEKTKFTKVKYLKILRVDKQGDYSRLWFFGLTQPWEVPRPPPEGYPYAGVIFLYDYPWELYEYSQIDRGTIRRKV